VVEFAGEHKSPWLGGKAPVKLHHALLPETVGVMASQGMMELQVRGFVVRWYG
jgi:hypothetical protein